MGSGASSSNAKALIDSKSSYNTEKVSTPRSKINKAKEQDAIISQSIDNKTIQKEQDVIISQSIDNKTMKEQDDVISQIMDNQTMSIGQNKFIHNIDTEQDAIISHSIDNITIVQDDVISQNIEKFRFHRVNLSNKMFVSFNQDFSEKLYITYKPKLNVTRKLKQWQLSSNTHKHLIYHKDKDARGEGDMHKASAFSWSYFPCRKPLITMISNDTEETKAITAYQKTLTHSDCSHSSFISEDQTIKAFTSEDQTQLIKEWIESSRHTYIIVKEPCGKCKRCRYNADPSLYSYRIDSKENQLNSPYRIHFNRSFRSKSSNDAIKTKNGEIALEFIIKSHINLINQCTSSSEQGGNYLHQLGRNSSLVLGYYATAETDEYVKNLMGTIASEIDIRKARKHLSWWIGSIVPKFKQDFSFSKKCPLQVPCSGPYCHCNIPSEGFVLQAAYCDRYGTNPPSISTSKNSRRKHYKYSQGTYLIDTTRMMKDETALKVINEEMKKFQYGSYLSDELILIQENEEIKYKEFKNQEEKKMKEKPAKITSKETMLSWPTNISKYECFYQVNEAKFNCLVERLTAKGTLTIFLSSPFDGCAEEREEFMQKIPALTKLCQKKGIQLTVIDYRTGITKQLGNNNQTVLTCLRAIDASNIFIGYFGARYGSSLLVKNKDNGWINKDVDVCLDAFPVSYPFLVNYRERSITEMEWQHAFLHGDNYSIEDKPISFFFYRSKEYDDSKASTLHDLSKSWYILEEGCEEAAQNLKQAIISKTTSLPEEAYGALIDGYETPELGAELMYACCETLIKKLLERIIVSTKSPIYQTHLCFVKMNIYLDIDENLSDYVKKYIEDIRSETENQFSKSYPFVITGDSGCGKSSFMASIVDQLLKCKIGYQNQFLFFHFCGCDNASQDLSEMLIRLYEEFSQFILSIIPTFKFKFIGNINDIFPEVVRIYEELGSLLPPAIIIIDAINQLDEKVYDSTTNLPSNLKWLPYSFPKNVKILFTCIEEDIFEEEEKLPPPSNVKEISRLDLPRRKALVLSWYERFHKKVDEELLSKLWESSQTENTMYLFLVLNDMIINATYDSINDGSYFNNILDSNDVPSLLSKIIERIQNKTRIGGKMQPKLVENILCYIYCSREGLSLDELQTLTSCKDPTYWSSFQYNLSQLLSLRQGLFTLNHSYVTQAIRNSFIYQKMIMKNACETDFILRREKRLSIGREYLMQEHAESNEEYLSEIKIVQEFLKQKNAELAAMFKIKAESAEEDDLRPLREQEYHERKANMRPSVIVVVRARPPNKEEIKRRETNVIEMKNKTVHLSHPNRTSYSFKYNFALVDVSQQKLFQTCGADIVDQVLNGNNVSVIAYGQTSSGKTYTMFGLKDNNEESKGLIPRTMENLLRELELQRSNHGWEWQASCMAVEIYKDKVFDLLRSNDAKARNEEYSKQSLQVQFKINTAMENEESTEVLKTVPFEVSFNPKQGVSDRDNKYSLVGRSLKKSEDLDIIMKEANVNRIMRPTSLNDQSSRSHCVVIIEIILRENTSEKQSVKVNLVDLAGSERLSRIGRDSEGRENLKSISPELIEESVATNKSLAVLNKCILALSDEKVKHIPYRESMLTKVLQDSLGGSSKLVLIGTISPTEGNYDETLSTLKYASLAKSLAVGKNRIGLLAEEEKNKNSLCEEFGLSESHIELYNEFYKLKNGQDWIVSNMANTITWTKEFKHWSSRLDSYVSKTATENIQWISLFDATCTDASCQRYLHVNMAEEFTCDITYLYMDSRHNTQFQVMIDSNVVGNIFTAVKGGTYTSNSTSLLLVAPAEKGLYMIWTRSVVASLSQSAADANNCVDWFETFVAWLRVEEKVVIKQKSAVGGAVYGNILNSNVKNINKPNNSKDINFKELELKNAVKFCNINNVTLLLSDGVNPNWKDPDDDEQSCLHIAAKKGFVDILKLLLQNSADIDLKDKRIKVDATTQKRNSLNKSAALELKNALKDYDISKVNSLLAVGINPNWKDRNDNEKSCLHIATEEGFIDMIELLVQYNANMDIQDKAGDTALIMAATENKTDIVNKLINHGANLNLQNKRGNTALMAAAHYGHTSIALILVQNGAQIDLQNMYGNTALMWAAKWGKIATVLALIHNGANLDLQNKRGETARDVADELTKKVITEKGGREGQRRTSILVASWLWNIK